VTKICRDGLYAPSITGGARGTDAVTKKYLAQSHCWQAAARNQGADGRGETDCGHGPVPREEISWRKYCTANYSNASLWNI